MRFRKGDRDSYLEALDREYSRLDVETGELVLVAPEYVTMSRRPGIGTGWFEKFANDVYPSDEVVIRGKSSKPPRFYDRLLEAASPEEMRRIQRARNDARDRGDETAARLRVREVCAEAKLSLYGGRDL